MHVRLGRIRHLVVDDVRDAVDVEAARGDVGGDQHAVACRSGTLRRPPCAAAACDRRAAPPRGCPSPLSRCASRSAPIFVRQKTSTGPSRRRAASCASHCVFSRAATVCTACEIVCAGPPRRPTWTYFGSRRISRVSFSTSSGIVAENSSVWRVGRQRREDALHVGPEAHVQHAVGFVEHQHLERR